MRRGSVESEQSQNRREQDEQEQRDEPEQSHPQPACAQGSEFLGGVDVGGGDAEPLGGAIQLTGTDFAQESLKGIHPARSYGRANDRPGWKAGATTVLGVAKLGQVGHALGVREHAAEHGRTRTMLSLVSEGEFALILYGPEGSRAGV